MNSKQRKKAGKATKVLVKAIEGGHFDEVLAALERPAFVERAAALLGHAWTWPPNGKGFYVSKAIAARRAILTSANMFSNGAPIPPGSYLSPQASFYSWRPGPPIQQPSPTKLASLKKLLRGSQASMMLADDAFTFVVPSPAPRDPYRDPYDEAVEAYRLVARRAGEGGAFDRLYDESYMLGGDSLTGVGEKIGEAIRELVGPPPDWMALRVVVPVRGRSMVCVVRP